MTRSFIELKIGTLIILVVAAVIASAYVTYNSLTYISESVQQQLRPDLTLVILKDIRTDILKVESNVKYYSLTGNSQYLNSYYDEIITIDNKIEQLKDYTKEITSKQVKVDSINVLLKEKLMIWQKMLSFRRDNRVNEAFNKLTEKLESTTDTMTLNYKVVIPDTTYKLPAAVVEPEKKGNFFSRLFKRKTDTPDEKPILKEEQPLAKISLFRDSSLVHTLDTTLHIGVNKSFIDKEISQIKEEEGILKDKLTTLELSVLSENEMLNLKLDQMIEKMENEELKAIKENVIEADELAFKTNRWIVYFVFAASFVLLLVFFVILNYIRKSNRYQKALVLAKDEAEKLSLAREQFVANMSHEIRTPMNALTGFTEQLLSMPLKSKQYDQLTIVKKSADHLMQIINNVLDFSKLEVGKLTLENIAFNPAETLLEAYHLFLPSAKAKNIDLKYISNEPLQPFLYGDPFRLRQILFNLLNNAIKFTIEGSVQFSAKTEVIKDDIANLTVTITDTGIGIHENKFDAIFEEFTQAEMNTTRMFGGTGLGLSIVKKLISLHNGTISLNSRPNEGTSFIFIIPYKICHENQELIVVPVNKPIDISALKKLTFLVADDDEYNKKLISAILDKRDLHYCLVSNGKDAIEQLENDKYDIVLMDIRMPVMDGMETTVKIRHHPSENISKVPVIALTATLTLEEEKKYLSLGMNAVLAKPFTENILIQTLLKVTENPINYLPLQTEHEHCIGLGSNNINENSFNIEKLYKLAGNDQNFVKEMMQMFIKTTQEGMHEIITLSKNNDWEEVANQSHKIKAPCKHFGADKLANYLKTIEDIARNGTNKEQLESIITETLEESDKIIQSIRKHMHEN